MGLHDRSEIVLTMANVDMLIDGRVGEKAEADLMSGGHHDLVVIRDGRAAYHVGALDGSASGASANGTSTIEHFEELLKCGGVKIRISNAPVASTHKPDTRRSSYRRNEGG